MNRPIVELRNLGPRCAEWLAAIGIIDEDGLRCIGAAVAYRELVVREVVRPHRMLLYAMGGALLEVDLNRMTREQKVRLEEDCGLY